MNGVGKHFKRCVKCLPVVLVVALRRNALRLHVLAV